MKEVIAIAGIAIFFGIVDADADNTRTDKNTFQVAQKNTGHQGRRWHPAVYMRRGTYRHRGGERYIGGGQSRPLREPDNTARTPESGYH